MSLEDQHTDRKSLRKVAGRTADWDELARDRVCYANGQGGRLLIGIEDGEVLPPVSQVVAPDLLDRLRKRINELTVNVQVPPQLMTAENGGQFIELSISRAPGVASTTDGRYLPRVRDACLPIIGDLFAEAKATRRQVTLRPDLAVQGEGLGCCFVEP